MPRIPELEHNDDEEVWLIPCECQDNHYFKMVWWEDDPDLRYASIEYASGNTGWGWYGLTYRIRNAWKAFRQGEYCYAEVMLNKNSLDTLQEFLDTRK